ncbi:TPA: AbiH family protein [Streptococcus suis]
MTEQGTLNITYLLGNGYDLQLGLKTAYSDFYEHLKNNKSKEFDDNSIFQEIANDKIGYWSDFELALGKHTNELNSEDKKVVDKFLEDADNLIRELATYLQTESKKLNANLNILTLPAFDSSLIVGNLKENEREIVIKLLNSSSFSKVNFNFVTFNYTNAIEKYVNKLRNTFDSFMGKKCTLNSPVHVHGSLGNYPIIGVNDESQLAPNSHIDLQEDLIKSHQIEETGSYNKEKGLKALESSDLIIIFGVSFGETDKEWWQAIAKILQTNKTTIIIYHFVENLNLNSTRQLRNETRDAKNRLLRHSDLTNDERKALDSKIYVILSKELFKFPILEK